MKKTERFFGLFEIMSTFAPNSCCIRLTVRTVDSQSTNTGSIPVCSTVSRRKTRRLFCLSPERTRRPVCRGKRNFDEDAWKGGAGPIGYLSATIGFLLSVAGCRRLPRRTDLSCAVRRFLLRGSAWLPHLFRRCRRTCLSGGSLPDEVPFGASVLGRRLLLIYLIARPDGGGGYLKIVLTRADSVRADRGRPSGDGRPDVRAKVAAVCLGQ